MAAPAFGTSGTRLGKAVSATAAVPVPASVASGDIIVVYLHSTASATTMSARPTGFAAVEGSPILCTGGVSGVIHVEWKRATAADTGTYSFTLSSSQTRMGMAMRYTGCVATGSPWDTPTSKGDTVSNTQTGPAISVTTAGPDRLLCYVAGYDNGMDGQWTPPTGFTEREGGNLTSKLEQSDRVQAVAGSSGTVQASTSAQFSAMNAWLGALIGTTVASATRARTTSKRR